jgi:hypothetical protein
MKPRVREEASRKTIKTLDIPGQKPIAIKLDTSNGEFYAAFGYKQFKNPLLKGLEEELEKAINDIVPPGVEQWEPAPVRS